jgi:integrase
MRFSFTKASIIAAPVGVHYDSKQSGFCVTVTPTSRRYGIYVSVRGTPVRRSLGDIDGRSVEQVRAEAARVIAELRESPKQKQVKATVGRVVELYTDYLETQGAKDSNYIDRAAKLYWPHLLDRTLSDVTVLELTTHHSKLKRERGLSAARYAVTILRSIYNYAESLELCTFNPAKKVKVAAAKSRETHLNEQEIKIMRECLSEMAPTPRAYLLLVLLTGLRRSNAAELRWEWVKGDVIVIPASASKNKTEMVIPLVPEAVELLHGRRSLDPVYVFPSTSRPNQPVSNVYEWVLDLRRRLRERGVTVPVTIHDLRRTFCVRLIARGASLPIAAKALGHVGLSSIGTYARVGTDTLREAMLRV